jgi:hypothetical protein
MTGPRRLAGILVGIAVGIAAPARADVVTDWNVIMLNTIAAGPPGTGPSRQLDAAMVHLAMHDAVQAIQRRFETYSPDISPTSGSMIAAAAKAARDVLANRFPAQTAALDTIYAQYLTDHQIAANDGGIPAGAQAAAAIIAARVGDGAYPVPSPVFFGSNEIGKWRPTVFVNNDPNQPASMTGPWLATTRTFAVFHTSQFFAPQPPRITSRRYTRDYNEVKALGRREGSTRTPEQTALANFYSQAPLAYWNGTMRALVLDDKYVTNVGDSARMFALVNVALADALMTTWQSKIEYNVWRPVTAIQLGESDGNRSTVGDPTWQPLFATPNYPDYVSGASSAAGAATEMLRLFFRDDRVNFNVVSPMGNRFYTRFSDAAQDVVDARIYMGIHFRFPDTSGRTCGAKVARWTYKYFLRSVEGDEFDFIRTLDFYEDLDVEVADEDDGQDEDDAE